MKKVVGPENSVGQRADRRALAEINDLIDDGVHDAASVLAWEVQRTCPGDPAVWLLLARIDYLRERYAAAIYAARMATRLAPSSPDAWFALASTAVTRSRWHAEGLDAALQATALAADRPKNWTVLAQLQLATGASYEAAVAAERAVAVDPGYRGGHLMLGEIALDAGEWAHAEAAFRSALALDETDRDARDGLAEALEAQDRDPAEVLDEFGHALQPTGEPLTRRLVASVGQRRPPGGGRMWSDRVAVIGAGSCLAVGIVLGLLIPGLGVVRGLIGAVAVILMWVAIRPTRPGPRSTQPPIDPLAPDDLDDLDVHSRPPEGTGHDEEPAVSENGREPADVQGADTSPATAADGAGASEDNGASTETAEPMVAGPPTDDDVAAPDDDLRDDMLIDMPDDPDELATLSRARLAVSDVELAHAAASRLDALAPGSIEAHRALGAVALAAHDYEQARVHYRKVLELEPLDQEAHERLALVSAETQRSGLRLPLRRFRGRE
ncbi:MAG: tetratricopeptide repeat protein [Actinobacteria bacterium]|nr:tetratricopeptide repeat protein [Actinomycetota bacterium]